MIRTRQCDGSLVGADFAVKAAAMNAAELAGELRVGKADMQVGGMAAGAAFEEGAEKPNRRRRDCGKLGGSTEHLGHRRVQEQLACQKA